MILTIKIILASREHPIGLWVTTLGTAKSMVFLAEIFAPEYEVRYVQAWELSGSHYV